MTPPAVDQDTLLLDGLRRGSQAAFAILVDRHQAPMLRLARFHVRSRATAEDVVQETWLAVFRGIDRFDGRSSLKTWMYRILTNRAKTMGEREGRTVAVATLAEREVAHDHAAVAAGDFLGDTDQWAGHWKTPPQQWPQDSDAPSLAREAVDVVAAAIAELPPVQRLVITLRDVDCWTSQEVCQVMDLTGANQRVLLHRARSTVRTSLAAYFEAADEA